MVSAKPPGTASFVWREDDLQIEYHTTDVKEFGKWLTDIQFVEFCASSTGEKRTSKA